MVSLCCGAHPLIYYIPRVVAVVVMVGHTWYVCAGCNANIFLIFRLFCTCIVFNWRDTTTNQEYSGNWFPRPWNPHLHSHPHPLAQHAWFFGITTVKEKSYACIQGVQGFVIINDRCEILRKSDNMYAFERARPSNVPVACLLIPPSFPPMTNAGPSIRGNR